VVFSLVLSEFIFVTLENNLKITYHLFGRLFFLLYICLIKLKQTMTLTTKFLATSTVIEALETILKNEKPKSLVAETNDQGEVIYFELKIKEHNPYAPYAHTSTVGRAIGKLNDLGLLYTNDDYCVYFRLNKDNVFTSAVCGYAYSYEDVNKIIQHFKSRLNIKPKKYDLSVGDYLQESNEDNTIKTIYVIKKKGHSDYTCLDALDELKANTFPTSIDHTQVVKAEDSELKPISLEAVEELVVELEKSVMVEAILKRNIAVGNVKKEDLTAFWKNYEIGKLISAYKRFCTFEYNLYRVFDNGKLLYDPLEK
jgi:hypothetical protein